MADAGPQPPMPKIDYKMIVLPAVMLYSKKIDFTDNETIQTLQFCFGTVAILVLTFYFFVYTRITANKNGGTKIWVPPKPEPSIPFIGPPPKEITVDDYVETTYHGHEVDEVKKAAQGIATTMGITFLMSLKFNIHMSLLVQAIMLPLNAYDNVLVKKYIFGAQKSPEGGLLYNEHLSRPTAESLAKLKEVTAAKNSTGDSDEATSSGKAETKGPVGDNEPRVVELSDDEGNKDEKKASDKKID